MSNLFKKLAFFTDAHFGRRSNNPTDLLDNVEFIKWFIDEAKTRGCETFIFGGDFFDNRHQIHLSTLNIGLDCLQMLNDAFSQCYFIPGNHDLHYRDRRDVSSIEFARTLSNVKIIRQPQTVGNVTLLPWLVKDEHKKLTNLASRYVFSHLEMPGFLMNAMVEMPDSPHAVHADSFTGQEFVFSGHFHMRQQKGNVIYTGNIMPFNFSDNWQEDRGAMFLDWGGEPEFVAWPGQPLFRTMRLSELLNEPEKLLTNKLTARVTIDIEISYEEAQLIKDTFTEQFGLRKVELVPQSSRETEQDFSGEVQFQSIDQIVIEGLQSIQGHEVRSDKLIEIYNLLSDT